MAPNKMRQDEMERRFDELLQAVVGGIDIIVSQGGMPLARLAVHPLDRFGGMIPGDPDPWYAVVIEQGENGYIATVPDLPPCIAAADSEAVAEELIREVIRAHLETLRLAGIDLPEPTTRAMYVQAVRKAA